ncbi:MAG: cytochrome c oxidase subunit II [Nocardioidaceae bacterium]|nr:cytochrome c oxidase subunit II [Nocardioidaceae bacterium]
MGLGCLVLLTGCSEETTEQWKRLGLPEAASDRADYVHDLWMGAWIAAFIIGGFTWALMGWVSVRYRRRREDELPAQVRYNLPIEVLYSIAPVIVVVVLFFFTVQTQDKELAEVSNPDHEVVVTAQQWSWTFNYAKESGAGGEDVYDTGTPAQDPELWLVEDETVNFTLHSPDVIHSFWVPSFYFKLDVIPGLDHGFSMTPTKAGTFVGRCAELCGQHHSRMLFKVIVTDRQTFDEHMQELRDAGQTGVLRGGRESETVDGLDTAAGGGE